MIAAIKGHSEIPFWIGIGLAGAATWAFLGYVLLLERPYTEEEIRVAVTNTVNVDNQKISDLQTKFATGKVSADKWEFSKRLRSFREPKPPCTYQLRYTQHSGNSVQFWNELLTTGSWINRQSKMYLLT